MLELPRFFMIMTWQPQDPIIGTNLPIHPVEGFINGVREISTYAIVFGPMPWPATAGKHECLFIHHRKIAADVNG